MPERFGYAFGVFMRSLRTLSIAFALALTAASLLGHGQFALAQSVDDAETDAEGAGERAEVAVGLVDETVTARVEIELQLVETIGRINDLSAELSTLSAGLDKLQEQISFADTELVEIASDLEVQAVDAYMTALASPGVSFVNSDSVEEAMVAGLVVEDVISSGQDKVDELVIKRRSLEDLQADYLSKQEEVADLKGEVDAEMLKLEVLFAEADSAVTESIRAANAADSEYRAALSAVDAAHAREAESRRQEERTTTTTSPPPSTTSPTTTPTTTLPSDTTSTTSGGGGGGWTFPPAVEQWRGLVQQHFPANRVDEALRIIQCESGGDPSAYNPYSGASGLFQFLPSTWATTAPKAGYPDASVFDPTANVASAAWLANRYQELGQYYWRAWSCRRVL